MPRIYFGPIGVDPLTAEQAIARLGELVPGGGGTVFTPNLHHLATAQCDTAFASAYRSAALCLCDGTPLRWAASMQQRIPERIAGSTFLPQLLEEASQRRWRVAFIGGRAEVAMRLRPILQQRYPGIQPVLQSMPTREILSDVPAALDALMDTLKSVQPQLVCVSLPSPLQEVWAHDAYTALSGGVFVCTGSAIDRLVGAAPKPPRWLGNAGLEWAWRVWQEPARLGPRYAADLRAFIPVLARAVLRRRPMR